MKIETSRVRGLRKIKPGVFFTSFTWNYVGIIKPWVQNLMELFYSFVVTVLEVTSTFSSFRIM